MIDRPLYIEKIMAYTDTPFVKILTGIRRCGKSTILKMIMEKLHKERKIPKEQIVSYRFDSMEYEGMTAKQLKKATKLVDKDLFLGLGWLLREDKVSAEEVEGELFIKLI